MSDPLKIAFEVDDAGIERLFKSSMFQHVHAIAEELIAQVEEEDAPPTGLDGVLVLALDAAAKRDLIVEMLQSLDLGGDVPSNTKTQE